MKQVYIVRHADAVAKDGGTPDFDRSLVKKGIKHSKEVSRRLRKSGVSADLFISSPANRAIETAHIFAKSLGYPVQRILLRESLYESTHTDDFLSLIREQQNKSEVILIFGHDPSLSALAQSLSSEFKKEMPKTAVVGLEFDVTDWSEIQPASGKLVYFDYPMSKALHDGIHKGVVRYLAGEIDDAISGIIVAVDGPAADNIKKQIKKASANVAGHFLKAGGGRKMILEQLLESEAENEPEKKRKTIPRADKSETPA